MEHLLHGEPISLIEAFLIFGMQNLNAALTLYKRDGFKIESRRVPFPKIIARINKSMVCIPSKELPQQEIFVMEYWIKR